MNLRLVSLLVVLFLAIGQSVWAWPTGWREIDDLGKPQPSALHARVPKDSECEKILMNAAAMLGRELTVEEIENSLEGIIAKTGEKLLDIEVPTSTPAPAPKPAPATSDSSHCFTGQTRVMIEPGRSVPIEKLKEGDFVVSLDLTSRRWVRNRIAVMHVTPDQNYGLLSAAGRTLEVTASERFLTDGEEYTALKKMAPKAALRKAQIKSDGSFSLMRRNILSYEPIISCGTVYNLTLEGEPRNFIVNSLVVHNGKETGP